MPHSPSAPTRTLPAKPSLAQLRKQAKELHKAYQAGDSAARAEVERFERKAAPANFALADGQRVLARAYGFSSWAKLKQHVDGFNIEAFCAAVKAGNVAVVRKLAKARPELVHLERPSEFGGFPLHLAVLNRDADMTIALMNLGADARVGLWPYRDATAAYTIAKERAYDEIAAIIHDAEERRRRELSSPGATISSKTDNIQKAILQDRCDEAIRILESDLSLIGACNVEQGATPLHVAAWKHNPEMTGWLLDRQAPVDARDAKGKTPLDYAAFVAGWSAHGRDFSYMENSRLEPARFHETTRLLRAKGAELTPRAAVAMGDKEAVLHMHREGRLTNDIHVYRGGLLSIAVRVNRLDMVTQLLDLGLDPDESATTDDGDDARSWGMPLWFTAMCGRHEIAELLLARGADVDAVVHACGDALSIADSTQDEEMKTLLLEHGARLTVERVAGDKDRERAKAILNGTMAAQSLNVDEPSPTDLAEQMLWAAGRSDPEIVRMCLPHMKRNRNDRWWNYVLMHATLPDSFKLILDHGVDPDVAGGGGYTILHHLATQHVKEEGRITRATMLLDAGASLDKREPLLQSTPLGWACRWGRLPLAQLFLDRGADASEADAERWATPLAWAIKFGHANIVELLLSHGAK
jgi:ankyrin repeat protein